MRSIPTVLTWEILRRGRWTIPSAIGGAFLFQLLVFGALTRQGAYDIEDPAIMRIHIIFTQVAIMSIGSAVFSSQGVAYRLFTKPIGNASLALLHLVPAGILSALSWVVCGMLLNVAEGLDWPILGPALFAAVAVPAVMATSWYTDRSPWIVVGLGGVACILGCWLTMRFGPLTNTDHIWRVVTLGEWLFLIAVGVASGLIGTAGLARQRRAEPLHPLNLLEWINQFFDSLRPAPASFASGEKAQAWFEWHSKGIMLPGIAISAAIVGFSIWFTFNRTSKTLLEAMVGMGVALPILTLLMGLAIGNFGPTDANSTMGPFIATRPLTSRALARVVLGNQVGSVGRGVLLWLVLFLGVCFLVGEEVHRELNASWMLALLIPVLCWVGSSLTTLMCLTGRTSRIGAGVTAFLLTMLPLFFVTHVFFSRDVSRHVFEGVEVILSFVAITWTAWCYRRARQRDVISTQGVVIAGAAVLLMTGVLAGAIWSWSPGVPLSLLGLALVVLCVVPFAAAPMAVAWNRHR